MHISESEPASPRLASGGSTSSGTRCRILYLIGQLGAGGSERQLVYLLQTIARDRYRPRIVVWHYSDNDVHVKAIRALGIPIVRLEGGASRLAKMMALRQIVRELKPEVIHSYSFHTNAAAWFAAQGTKTVPVGSIRVDFIRDQAMVGPWLGRSSARWPGFQICNSVAAAQNVKRARSVFVPRRLSVIRNGLDLKRYNVSPLPADGGVILGVGSLFQWKRWDRLLVAAAELKRRGVGFQVRIAGDGPLRNSLESLARDLDIADRVQFLGNVSVIEERLRAASVLVHTAESEGCPNVVMEAMASGRPVVATDSGDVPLLVDHNRTGFVVRRGDDAGLVDHLQTLLTNPALAREMGIAARLKAEREFGLERLVSETLAAYQNAGWTG